ncbi:single-stranded DNA-binding protein [Anaerovoracaceae bacterium 42-11]
MNKVELVGRLTRDPEVKTTQSGTTIANFSVAIDRPTKQGGEKITDFPRVTAIGKIADNVAKYCYKGMLVGVTGRLQTGSYTNKDGVTVYTTDVLADNVEFLEWRDKDGQQPASQQGYAPAPAPAPQQGYAPGAAPAPQQGYAPGPAPAPQQGCAPAPVPAPQQGDEPDDFQAMMEDDNF